VSSRVGSGVVVLDAGASGSAAGVGARANANVGGGWKLHVGRFERVSVQARLSLSLYDTLPQNMGGNPRR